jgi:ribosomal protein L16 Arg81 hydroxylase
MAILEQILSPLSFADFRRDYLFQRPFAAPSSAREFRKLISWPMLLEIFAQQKKGSEFNCWVARKGRLSDDLSFSAGALEFNRAHRAFDEGYTILVRHSEKANPALAKIGADFEEFFHDPVDIQLYVTPAGEEGFDWHYDLEEVFVIQSSGEKEFYLREPKTMPPLDHVELPETLDFTEHFQGPEIRCHLKAGDVLYIPAGWWHKARALTPSFHLSVGVLSSERRRL